MEQVREFEDAHHLKELGDGDGYGYGYGSGYGSGDGYGSGLKNV